MTPYVGKKPICHRGHDKRIVGVEHTTCAECRRGKQQKRRKREGGAGHTQVQDALQRHTILAAPLFAAISARGLDVHSAGYIINMRTGRKDSARELWRLMRRGTVSLGTADEFACALGMHPCEIWTDWFADDVA